MADTLLVIVRDNGFSGWKDLAKFLKGDVKFYTGCTGTDKMFGCGYKQDSRCKGEASKKYHVETLIEATFGVDNKTANNIFWTLHNLGWITNQKCWRGERTLFNV